MDTNMLVIVVAAVAVVVVALAAWFWLRRSRTDRLRTKFGPEYERTVHEAGSAARAEAVLDAREKKVASFRVRPLTPEERQRYVTEWADVQALFVDRPTDAVVEADRLITQAMHTRGYPVTDFRARAENLTVEHARTVEHYRVAHDIVERHGGGAADTEELRQAMVHFRALFEDLVGTRDNEDVRRRA